MLKVLDLSDNVEWRNIVSSLNFSDFYHTYDYHKMSYEEGEGHPQLFVYSGEQELIVLPLLERDIDGSNSYRDLTSVYGYAGPLFSPGVDSHFIRRFQAEFVNYLETNNIVSVFSRLHPLIPQKAIISSLGDVKDLSKTVTVELELNVAEQRRKYRKSNKSEINKLRRTAECRVASTIAEVNEFIEIYIDNMKRLNAAERYFFDQDYFDKLLNATDFDTEIVLAVENDTIMAGAIFTYSNDMVQYHFAGTREEFFHRTPMKLIIDDVRLRSTEAGYKYFHLGGGVGSKEDSLFKFKSGFSDRYDQFSVWRYIVNTQVYNDLVASKRNKIKDEGFFPLYRG